ncbi:hypothetical protein TVAG_324050 [Trichomonas vaginalis G3]|uniref:DnaK protein n=1 Tax=Trichomonas vaginalis (strain ATCC PRA-98 / G3) TaxID=412133 RepID=A2F4A7_TRIV3|nr:ATP binding [Trichomonas vaginalis G3]EAY00286.1 hypothetical protein TVAG_324050 [Trichomonas vaginalis G3]KAI5492712.1 ATP binding [Trichomonas vaginalis G3]|eukprot:XP_001313215.1 hypothetical protein [Trichomonas vaginalis G3]
MFSFFVVSSIQAVIGVDVGSEALRASMINIGQQIETLGGHESVDSFPYVLTVVPKKYPVPDVLRDENIDDFDFIYNDKKKMAKFPNSTIRFASSLLGKLRSKEFIDLLERRRLWGKPSNISNNRLFVAGLPPETVFTRAFHFLNSTINSHLPHVKLDAFSVAVPKFFTQGPRDSLHTAAKRVGLKPFIVDSTRAIGTWYGQTFYNQIKSTQNIVFFSIGALNTEIYTIKFSRAQNKTLLIEEIEYEFADTIGGRDFDVLIADYIANQFKHPITPKAEQTLLFEAEKIKKLLTVNKYTNGYIELLDDKHDLSYFINISEFKSISEPILNSIENLAKKIKTKPDKLFLLGGSCRMPMIQDLVKQVFKLDSISTSLLKDEMMSQATTIFSATMNSQFLMKPIEYTPIQLYSPSIFGFKGVLPINTTTFTPKSNYYVQISASQMPIGSSMFYVFGTAGQSTSLGQTKDGLFRFHGLCGKTIRNWKNSLLEVYPKIMKQEFDKLELFEATNRMYDLILMENKSVYGENSQFSCEYEKIKLLKAVNQTNRWFLSQKKYKLDTLTEKIKFLEDSASEIFHRIQNHRFLEASIKNLTEALLFAETEIRRAPYRDLSPQRKKYRLMIQEIQETKLWLEEKKILQSKILPHENPVLVWTAVSEKTEKILRMIHYIVKHRGPYVPNPLKNIKKQGNGVEVDIHNK